MDYLFQDGGKPKKTKSKTKTTKTTKSKSSTKTGSKTTKSKTTTKKSSSKKGGNFLGTVGELVAPTGWETFATTAGLFALDRADAAFRRGKKTKSSAKKGGMRGGYDINTYLEEFKKLINGKFKGNNSNKSFIFDTKEDYRKKLRYDVNEIQIEEIMKAIDNYLQSIPKLPKRLTHANELQKKYHTKNQVNFLNPVPE
jgi:hypothetical protein